LFANPLNPPVDSRRAPVLFAILFLAILPSSHNHSCCGDGALSRLPGGSVGETPFIREGLTDAKLFGIRAKIDEGYAE
jgi:hypothetical protein